LTYIAIITRVWVHLGHGVRFRLRALGHDFTEDDSSWMLRRAVWHELTDVSEVLTASIMRAMIIMMITALMMEAVSTSETSTSFYQTARRNSAEDSHLYTCRRENLKSHDFTELVCVDNYNCLLKKLSNILN
jgi:hypothetical protein